MGLSQNSNKCHSEQGEESYNQPLEIFHFVQNEKNRVLRQPQRHLKTHHFI